MNEKPLAVDILVIIKSTKERIAGYEKDLALYKQESELEHAVDSSDPLFFYY